MSDLSLSPGTPRFIGRKNFGAAIAQIVILDAAFSVDSILTAIGITERLGVMIAALILAIGVMLLTSQRLSEFVDAHPPLIILCLGFLLMVGFSHIADGVGFQIPKGLPVCDRILHPD